ncbi:HEAT repeat domain-containing protein [Flammeovirgaceae bacterium SG7u.111]|nr:HEAT repeat domain-containing protein [Flammeovirgaceae bacterium SG7u.132]WPO38671.1 HEAT repeat domain-containing protein [Flammeovirgaceae bacterium SG7u.111]
METKNIKNKLLDYIEGSLPDNEMLEVKQAIKQDDALFREYDELRIVMEGMDKSPKLDSPEAVGMDFYKMLEGEKEKQKLGALGSTFQVIKNTWNGSITLKIAASVALFLMGYFIDKQIEVKDIQTTEIAQMREEIESTKTLVMLTLLKQQSASERIKAIGYTYDFENADSRVVDALISTLKDDKNVNVRLAATEALAHFAHNPKVVNALLETLPEQTDPEIQIIIIDLLVKMNETRARQPIETLLNEQELIDIVRSKAQEGVSKLL